jgi:hypothetical protein
VDRWGHTAFFPLPTSPIHQRPAGLPQQIVSGIWQDSVPDHDFQKETEDFQRKMIRFGSVLRMSVRRPPFCSGSTLAGGIFQSVVTKAKNGRKLIVFNYYNIQVVSICF